MVNICNGQNWRDALLQVMPARKGAREKSFADENSDSYDETEPPTSTKEVPIVWRWFIYQHKSTIDTAQLWNLNVQYTWHFLERIGLYFLD